MVYFFNSLLSELGFLGFNDFRIFKIRASFNLINPSLDIVHFLYFLSQISFALLNKLYVNSLKGPICIFLGG